MQSEHSPVAQSSWVVPFCYLADPQENSIDCNGMMEQFDSLELASGVNVLPCDFYIGTPERAETQANWRVKLKLSVHG